MLVGIPKMCVRSRSGAIINAIGGPIAMGAPIQISAAWFPPHVSRLPSHFQLEICTCPVALFLNQQFLKMASISTFLLGILPKDQELEKVIWPNIALSTRTGPHTLYNVDYNGAIFQKSFSGNNF